MVKREKRLETGIDSLEKQKELHSHKLEAAKASDNIDLVSYYEKEVLSLDKRIADRKAKLSRKE